MTSLFAPGEVQLKEVAYVALDSQLKHTLKKAQIPLKLSHSLP